MFGFWIVFTVGYSLSRKNDTLTFSNTIGSLYNSLIIKILN